MLRHHRRRWAVTPTILDRSTIYKICFLPAGWPALDRLLQQLLARTCAFPRQKSVDAELGVPELARILCEAAKKSDYRRPRHQPGFTTGAKLSLALAES
jgi:hypothetical protein